MNSGGDEAGPQRSKRYQAVNKGRGAINFRGRQEGNVREKGNVGK